MNENMKTVYLVRHGKPLLPTAEKYYLGQTDVPLAELGLEQAQWLRQFFAEQILRQPITAIYHSPLQRCRVTAEVIADSRLPCVSVPELQEISLGQWELLPIEQIKRQQPTLYQRRGQLIDRFCPPDGESFLQCQRRSVKAFQQIADGQPVGGASIVVAHAGVNRCILSWLKQQPLRELLSIPQPYACVTEVRQADEQWRIGRSILCPL